MLRLASLPALGVVVVSDLVWLGVDRQLPDVEVRVPADG
jgi:hypothetical protein